MDADTFERFRHRAVHTLQDLNAKCEQEFPRVAVGSTSTTTKTWLWGWANESLPTSVTARICEVRDFGNSEALSQLTEPKLPDEEYLGWDLTAIAAEIIGAKGAYRCPGKHGYAWCSECDKFYQAQGKWNDENEDQVEIKLVCHRCYESLRTNATTLSDE
jgi:hypothetical protein